MNSKPFPAFLLLVAFCLWASACTPSGPRSPYPPADSLRMAEPQRHEFVQLFLQGRWCEARAAFERSVENYLMQDDFCSAARNHVLAWKLKEHLGMGDQADLEAARILVRTGRDCPGVPVPAPDSDASVHTLLHEKDLQYREMIADSRFKALSARLMAEPDPLYASVYGRKAALAALRSGQADQAEALILQTRDLDARQGWVVFLIQDWKILHDLTKDSDRKEEILQRIEKLEDLVQPCTP